MLVRGVDNWSVPNPNDDALSASVALVLLGAWILVTFAVTNATALDQFRSPSSLGDRDARTREQAERSASESVASGSDD